jgi:hypothetical protein
MVFVPEGQADRSLARSAWESVPRENRPVGYGMIGRSIPESQRYFSSKMCAAFLKEGYILLLKGWCPMMFELVLDVTDRFLNLRESVRTPARIRPYPTGRLFWVALAQALRARLRSHRPSGTKAIRPSKGFALS